MNKILEILQKITGGQLIYAVISISEAIKQIMQYLNRLADAKDKKQQASDRAQIEKQIDDVSDKGQIDDVLKISEKIKNNNVVKSIIILCALSVYSGCTSIEINTVKPYEGRYDTIEKAINALNQTTLDRNESVWLISNETLKTILKNVNGK